VLELVGVSQCFKGVSEGLSRCQDSYDVAWSMERGNHPLASALVLSLFNLIFLASSFFSRSEEKGEGGRTEAFPRLAVVPVAAGGLIQNGL